ncbi:MAG: sigma factor, ECF subfamily protein [Verrucomicrobiae bacterium]|nr:sigma factor, ECF subfamily protein [Verrucomicrobiae bacterium]
METREASEQDVTAPGADPGQVTGTVEHLFRHEAGRMVAILTRAFGVEHLGLAEDVVQETLGRALRTWPYYGIPKNPAAWIMRSARNLALDAVRRQKVFRNKEPEIIRVLERSVGAGEEPVAEETIADDRLRLMFVCCHPRIPLEAQAALALKTLCGFGVTEIARAFLTTEVAVAKRLTRARQWIREAGIPFEIPEGEALGVRLTGVWRCLYLLYSEGYKASTGDRLVREDLCGEAIRLTGLLAAHSAGDRPTTHALLALMLLSGARSATRTDEAGELLALRDQDRTRWDRGMIARGMYHLARSGSGGEAGEYHLQAGIAACHAVAVTYEATDWRRVLELYDRLLVLDDSPIVALNRAVAVGEVEGPGGGIEAVHRIRDRARLESYHLFHAVLGEFEARRGEREAASGHFRRAIALAPVPTERRFLERRALACEAGDGLRLDGRGEGPGRGASRSCG